MPYALIFVRDLAFPTISGEEVSPRHQYTYLALASLDAGCDAVAESFFSSLKKERIRKRIYKTRDLARADIFDYIELFYNRTRRHSHFGYVSPEAFERTSM